MAGLLPWNYFAHSVAVSASSVLRYTSLVRKVNFPLELLPLAGVLSQLPDLIGGIVVYFLLATLFRVSLSFWVLFLPLLIALELLFALSVGMLFASFNVFYRDFNDIMQVLMSAWFFATPIVYAGTMVPQEFLVGSLELNVRALWFLLNPMASLVVGYRDILYRGQPFALGPTLSAAAVIVVFFIMSYAIYRRRSTRFAEVV
jgi:ABC-type polysaccharide/polyol phosphate export permease